ncbi:hypothetical protein JXB41_08375 [Candidatus Woesearchaeota archaeon]|nr:hypothetical protein [Candidatus Woesearchaeota archaeon]
MIPRRVGFRQWLLVGVLGVGLIVGTTKLYYPIRNQKLAELEAQCAASAGHYEGRVYSEIRGDSGQIRLGLEGVRYPLELSAKDLDIIVEEANTAVPGFVPYLEGHYVSIDGACSVPDTSGVYVTVDRMVFNPGDTFTVECNRVLGNPLKAYECTQIIQE